jgi:hypothetical protein
MKWDGMMTWRTVRDMEGRACDIRAIILEFSLKETGKSPKEPYLGLPVSQLRFEASTSRIQVCKVTATRARSMASEGIEVLRPLYHRINNSQCQLRKES